MKFVIPAVFVAALVAAPFLPTYYQGLAIYACILAIFATSANISLGQLGLISFGHAAFFGLGAYAAGLLNFYTGMNYWLAVPLAILPGVALGALVGLASLRLSGAYFAIATLVTSEILRLVALNWVSFTRGPMGVVVHRPREKWLEALTGRDFGDLYLMLCILVLALVLFVVSRVNRSLIGRAWVALRDQPKLAESVGIWPLRYKVIAIAMSGGIAALAGGLFVPRVLVLSPDLFSGTLSATALLAAILGGRGAVMGPVLGGIVFAVAPELLRVVDEYRLAIFALLLLVVVRVRPDGLISLFPRRKTVHIRPPSALVEITPRQLPATLSIEHLSRHFGGLKAVEDVSFEVRRGEILGLIGPNGAGKTTCLSLISAFLSPNSGVVRLGQLTLSTLSSHQAAQQGVVRTFQHTTVCMDLSVYENVLIGTHLLLPETTAAAVLRLPAYQQRECKRQALAWAAICFVGLEERANELAGSLAYGEQRMLSIAVALATRPGFLLLDEPAAGLNHTEALVLARLLTSLREKGFTIAIVDHNLRMMMKLCDRIVVLHHGRMLAEGDPVTVRNTPAVIEAYLGTSDEPEKQGATDA